MWNQLFLFFLCVPYNGMDNNYIHLDNSNAAIAFHKLTRTARLLSSFTMVAGFDYHGHFDISGLNLTWDLHTVASLNCDQNFTWFHGFVGAKTNNKTLLRTCAWLKTIPPWFACHRFPGALSCLCHYVNQINKLQVYIWIIFVYLEFYIFQSFECTRIQLMDFLLHLQKTIYCKNSSILLPEWVTCGNLKIQKIHRIHWMFSTLLVQGFSFILNVEWNLPLTRHCPN